ESGLAPQDRIRVVHYGVDAPRWVTSDAERNRSRAELGLSADAVAVGIASRLISGKGHDLLIEAFARALENAPTLRLVIAGDGPEREALVALTERLCPIGTVQYLGFVDDVRFLLGG